MGERRPPPKRELKFPHSEGGLRPPGCNAARRYRCQSPFGNRGYQRVSRAFGVRELQFPLWPVARSTRCKTRYGSFDYAPSGFASNDIDDVIPSRGPAKHATDGRGQANQRSRPRRPQDDSFGGAALIAR